MVTVWDDQHHRTPASLSISTGTTIIQLLKDTSHLILKALLHYIFPATPPELL